MKQRSLSVVLFVALVFSLLFGMNGSVQAQVGSTSFTYQGSLGEGGSPANGTYDFEFRLFNAATAGTQIGTTLVRDDVAVSNGLFVVALDFGAVFDGAPRYLEIAVRGGASAGDYTTLTPRQELTVAPMAIYSNRSGVSESSNGLLGRPVSGGAPTAGQVLKWNGSAWIPQADNDTTYTAGQGLNLFGNRFEVRFAGAGSSTFAARSDHTHHGQFWAGSNTWYGLWVESNTNATGLVATSRGGRGIEGQGNGGTGVIGFGGTGRGVEGHGDAYGILGFGRDRGAYTEGQNIGILSFSGRGGRGVEAQSSGNGTAVIAFNESSDGYAGWFQGRVHVTGRLSKAAGSFMIDHPLDPANKYLSHSFVESPDMMNIYNGTVVLDADGKATVSLPKYFQALNIEYRYQLTPIGGAAPDLHIASEISNNRFGIAGGTPGLKVSWQVTGIRNDPYARDNRIVVEEEKPKDQKGTYLYQQAAPQPANGAPATVRPAKSPSSGADASTSGSDAQPTGPRP